MPNQANLKYVVLLGCLLVFLALGAVAVFANPESDSDMAASSEEHFGPLDGMVFKGMLGPGAKPPDVKDVFVFENGTFVSKECELRCDYPARPYFVREIEGKTEFISHTKCPNKDAEIVWQGIVDGDKISGTATWIIKRWYWTITNRFDFEGELQSADRPVASAE